jgi:hypothetical protein
MAASGTSAGTKDRPCRASAARIVAKTGAMTIVTGAEAGRHDDRR